MKRHLQSTRFWLICIAGIFLLGTFSMFFFQSPDKGSIAVISRGGVELDRIDLSEVDEDYSILFDDSDGVYNLVSVTKDEIAVIDASCPDKICINQGYISGSEKPIVCLPNKFTITIESDNSTDELDGIVS